MNDDLVSETAAARMLGFDPKTCRKHGFFPPAALVLGGPERVRRLYRRSDIERAVVDLATASVIDTLVDIARKAEEPPVSAQLDRVHGRTKGTTRS